MEDSQEITKAIVPVAGLGTRFLPLSLVLPKEFFPLVDRPVVHYIAEELKQSGIKEVAFVTGPREKMLSAYFHRAPEIEKLLAKRKKEHLLKEFQQFEAEFQDMLFSFMVQKQPLGDGHAILQAEKFTEGQPVAVSFGDDVVAAEDPVFSQLSRIFKTCRAPVIMLKSVPRERVSAYGSVAVEKISSNLYKIKKIIEKPEASQIQSNLVIVGKYILTPEVFDYLKKAKPSEKGEIILGEVFSKMLHDGNPIYGYEAKGEWLECGDKSKWLKSFFYLALNDPVFGKDLREYLKQLR
ncbi:MAG: UTP--glucose-1-phosphate uridylyltransferase [Candidatus Saccharimonadales bacterium]